MAYNNLKHIEDLLEKYLNADASLQEEQQLQTYFAQDNVAPHLAEYKVMFGYFSKSREEQFTKNVPLQTEKRRKLSTKWISVAAVAVLCMGAYFGVVYNSGVNTGEAYTAQEKQEAEKAYRETKKAFMLLAQNLQKGREQMGYLNELEETKQKIFNNANKEK